MTAPSFQILDDHPREFFRLMDLPLPVPDNYEHYLAMWLKYDPTMRPKVHAYNEYLKYCSGLGMTPQAYRADHAEPKLVDHLKKLAILDGYVAPPMVKNVGKDHRDISDGQMLVSFDIVKANYSALRLYAFENGVFPSPWERFCELQEIHPFLSESKMFRQHCFGKYEPSKLASLQKRVIAKVIERLALDEEIPYVYISHDEFAVPYPQCDPYKIMAKIHDLFGHGSPLQFKTTIYRTDPVVDISIAPNEELERQVADMRKMKMSFARNQRYEEAAKHREMERDAEEELKTDYDRQFDAQMAAAKDAKSEMKVRTEYEEDINGNLQETKKRLVSVPGNKFYMYFRTLLLKEPLQEKDILFQQDGMLAKWLPAVMQNGDKAQEHTQ